MMWDFEKGDVAFDEVECAFENNKIWKQGNEMLMYEFLWWQLENRNLTAYNNETQHKIILLYPLIIISKYKTFVNVGRFIDGNCEFYYNCAEIAEYTLADNEIGFLYALVVNSKQIKQEEVEITFDIREMLKELAEYYEEVISEAFISELGYEKLYGVFSAGYRLELDKSEDNPQAILVNDIAEFENAVKNSVGIETVINQMKENDMQIDLSPLQDPILSDYIRQFSWVCSGAYIEYGEH